MLARINVSPDVEGIVLGTDWLKENTCKWNMSTGVVHSYDITFQSRLDTGVQMMKSSVHSGAKPDRSHKHGPLMGLEPPADHDGASMASDGLPVTEQIQTECQTPNSELPKGRREHARATVAGWVAAEWSSVGLECHTILVLTLIRYQSWEIRLLQI